jgi:hypothetical protein
VNVPKNKSDSLAKAVFENRPINRSMAEVPGGFSELYKNICE